MDQCCPRHAPYREQSKVGIDPIESGYPMLHKFHVGETVTMSPATSRNVPGGAYVVTKRLPDNGTEPEYRIRSASEPYERVARESELTKM